MKKKTKIVLCTLFITLILFSVTGNIFAQINQNYGKPNKIEESDLDGKVTNSTLANVLGALVYALASLAESLVGSVFESISGDPTFPWADRVIFNSVPFLDINFFNPSSGSLFLKSDAKSSSELEEIGDSLTNVGNNVINGTSPNTNNATMLAKIVRNIYFTMLTLSIGLLSVVVGIMAIKLAISTIAAEKAKYKEAITNWLFAIIMIFTVHFAMAFIFFINEKMVEVASSLLSNKTVVFEENDNQARFLYTKTELKNMLIGFFNLSAKANGKDISNPKHYLEYILDYWWDNEYMKDYLKFSENVFYSQVTIKENYSKAEDKIKDYFLVFQDFAKNNFYIKQDDFYIPKNQSDLNKDELIEKISESSVIKGFYVDYLNDGPIFSDDNFINDKVIPTVKNIAIEVGFDGSSSSSKNIVSSLGKWFKESAWNDGWIFSYVTFQGALLYAIFVTQSILFFFAYTKRFFYVVILAMLAPLVIIYDFLGKNI